MNRRELFPILGAAVSALEAAEYKPRLLSEREYAMVTSLANIILPPNRPLPDPESAKSSAPSKLSWRMSDGLTSLEAAEYKPRLLSERDYAMVISLANITQSSCTSEPLADRSNRGEMKRI